MNPGDLFIKNRSYNYSLPNRELYIFMEDHHEEESWGWFLGRWGLELLYKPDFDPVEEPVKPPPSEAG